ncbi:MAG: hypothetical protein JRJ23_08975 [Deltaproteobacteria bacterium]|nr:hypothetical protein [Deltaproteobacteria bacterium]
MTYLNISHNLVTICEHEVVQAVEELPDEEVKAIAVSLWYSYMNPMHNGSEA